MPITIIATPGAANANSFLTLAEAQAYWDTRLFTDDWDNCPDQNAALVLATRTLTSMLARRSDYFEDEKNFKYIHIFPTWTGQPATTTQKLPWPRTGMFDVNGNVIASTVVPDEIKNATAELAGQMSKADRLLDNDAAAQGISSVRAGSVSVSFSGKGPVLKALPDIVMALLVPSWITDDSIEPTLEALFDVL